MANIQERRNKDGKLISYSVRVHRGRGADGKQLKPYTATFEVSPTWTEKSARKKAEAFAATFEKECREGTVSDSRLKFAEYCDYVIDLKEQRGAKHSTIVLYRGLTTRIYPQIGHIKLKELRADHLNTLYSLLAQPGQNKRTGGGLSPKSITEHHRLISTVLDQAEKEGLQCGRQSNASQNAKERSQLFPAGTDRGHSGRARKRTAQMENPGSFASDYRGTARGSAGP